MELQGGLRQASGLFIRRWARVWLSVGVILVMSLGIGGALAPRVHAAPLVTVCFAPLGPCDFTDINAAISAATTPAGATIRVSAQTYALTAPITVNKTVILQGAQAGVDARTRTGAETVIDASGLASGNGYALEVGAPNVTIDGFTVTSAKNICVTGLTASGVVIQNNIITSCNAGIGELGGDTLTIWHNLLRHMDVATPTPFHEDAIYDDAGFSNLVISSNAIVSSGRAIVIPFEAGHPSAAPGTLTIYDNTIENGTYLWNVTGTIDHNTISGNAAVANADPPGLPTLGIRLGGQNTGLSISNNTFTNLQAAAVQVINDAGYPANSAVAITGNAINEDVSSEPSNSTSYLVDLHDVAGTMLVNNNSVLLSGTYPNGGANSTNAIQLAGAMGAVTIAHNILVGVGGVTSTGIAVLDALSATSTIALSKNVIRAFVDGVSAPNLATGAIVHGSDNCIYGNSEAGAANGATGAAIDAVSNWWGTATGPSGPGNASGMGNSVTSNITFKPFLTSAPLVCATPTSTLTIGNPSASGTPVQVDALTPLTISASAGAQAVATLHYRVYAQGSTPPAFTIVNGTTTTFHLSGSLGLDVADWYAVDSTGNVEPSHTQTLQLVVGTPSSTLTIGSPNVPGSPVQVGTTTPLTLNATTVLRQSSVIHYRVYAQGAAPPAFTTVNSATVTVKLPGNTGFYVVDWYASNASGNETPVHSFSLQLILFTPGEDVMGVPPGSSTTPAAPYPGATGNANTTSADAQSSAPIAERATTPHAARAAAVHSALAPSLPRWEVELIVALLVILLLGGGAFAFQTTRAFQQETRGGWI